jgi:hypothetical protein
MLLPALCCLLVIIGPTGSEYKKFLVWICKIFYLDFSTASLVCKKISLHQSRYYTGFRERGVSGNFGRGGSNEVPKAPNRGEWGLGKGLVPSGGLGVEPPEIFLDISQYMHFRACFLDNHPCHNHSGHSNILR